MSGEEGFLARWSRRKRAAAGSGAAPLERPDPAAPEATAGPPPADAPAEAPEARTPAPEAAAAAAPSPAEPGPAGLDQTASNPAEPEAAVAGEAAPGPAFDLAGLPPVEGLTAEADIGALFRPGVPAALRGAVLRRMWTLDPAIRDFVGPADYAWDYNAPGGVPGSTLELGGEVARLLSRAVDLGGGGDGPAAPDAAGPTDDAEAAGTPEAVAEAAVPTEPAGSAARAPGGGPAPDLAAAEPDSAAPDAAASDAEEPIRRPRRHGGARPT